MSGDKIGAQHRARKAVLYVRQSSAHQVQYNRESQVLQYAMRDRLVQLGWSDIEIIDEDLGCSAAGGTTRAGFERMVAEVCLGKVGAVAAREVSRATATIGSSLSRCAAWLIHCSSIRRPSMRRDKAMTGCSWG
jgi:DNA invertase Pin-like site-specific DNA recombinase